MTGPLTDDSNATADEVSIGQALGRASIEVGLFAVPVVVVAVVGAFTWRPTVLWLAVCGWVGLSLSLGGSRATERITVVRWSHPSSTVDKVTTAIAYNGVLGLGILVSTIAWLVTHWFIIGVIVAAVMPIWLLKHIRVVLALTKPEKTVSGD